MEGSDRGNDKRFLNDSLFHLKKGGIAIINVPAVNLLYSKYDKLIGHIKRYKKQDLIQIINKKMLSYFWNNNTFIKLK